MQIRLRTSKSDGEEVAACRDAADVHRLGHVTLKVCDELDSIGTGRVLAVADLACFGLSDAALKDLGLVGESANDTPLQGVIPIGVHLAFR